MGKLKFSDWLMIAKYKAGLITLSFADQNRFGIYLEYSHEDLMTIRDYADAYANVNYQAPTVEETVIEVEEALTEEPKMEAFQPAQRDAVLELSGNELKVYMFHTMNYAFDSIVDAARQLNMSRNTYSKAYQNLVLNGWLES